MRSSTTARLALLAAVWGSSFLWIKLALRGLSPVEVTLARLLLGATVLFVIVAVRRHPLPRSPSLWSHIAVAALFANAAPYLLFALGEQHVSSSTAIILGVAVLGESVSGLTLAGIALILAGVTLTRKGGGKPEPVLPE